MRIAQPPYYAHIRPQSRLSKFLWRCVIQREGSPDIVSRHELGVKEDACCVALIELSRLQQSDAASRSVPKKPDQR
jgi:hypothetical protein